MNIKRAKEEIKNTIESYLTRDEFGDYVIPTMRQRPVLLIGAPGIGKTQIMEQVAKECQVGLVSYTITHHTRQSAIGLPFISRKMYGDQEYAITEYTMSEIVASVYEKMEKTGRKEGILFIDEVNCVSETLAPAMLQFLQYKSFGNHQIPEGWIIVAAGNPPEYNKSVRDFDVVTMDRVKKIDVEPDYPVWKEYAYKAGIHPAIISYLDTRTQYFYKMETTVDGRFFATPRGWEDLSRLLSVYEQIGKEVDRDVVIQYIQHDKIARDFANYLSLYEKYQMDEQLMQIFSGTIHETMLSHIQRAQFDERLGVISLVLNVCTEKFRRTFFEESVLEQLMKQLRDLKEGLLGVHSDQPLIYMHEIVEGFRAEWEREKQAEALSREGNQGYRKTLSYLVRFEEELKAAQPEDGEEAFALVSEWFGDLREAYLDMEDEAGEALEYAFDFMEAAFANGQEMVIFVTELNTNYYSIRFLERYECERYYTYNRILLFEEGEKAIASRLDALI